MCTCWNVRELWVSLICRDHPIDDHYGIISVWLYLLNKYHHFRCCQWHATVMLCILVYYVWQQRKPQNTNRLIMCENGCPVALQCAIVICMCNRSSLLYNYERTYQKIPVRIVEVHKIGPTPIPTKGVDTGCQRNVLTWENPSRAMRNILIHLVQEMPHGKGTTKTA